MYIYVEIAQSMKLFECFEAKSTKLLSFSSDFLYNLKFREYNIYCLAEKRKKEDL
jgi:hypothetical protein